jgi:large repetitive protein
MKLTPHIKFICLIMIFFIWADKLYGQGCSSSTPHYTIDMTGAPDSVWVSPSTTRSGQCCGASSSDKCIHFTITLDVMSQGVSVNLSGGTGATYYNVGCGTSVLVGDTFCLSGVGPHEVTICKPGSNIQTYTITSVTKPRVVKDTVLINPSCSKTLRTKGFNPSTIKWTSVGNNSTYNSYLSCLSGCDTTVVTIPSTGFPAYVDYVVSGYNVKLTCDTNKFYDTVRVFMYSKPTVSLLPKPAYLCAGLGTKNITATATGGLAPYKYLWSNASTAATQNLSVGTYWVRVTDSLGCSYGYDTVTIAAAAKPAASIAGADTVCMNAASTYRTTALAGKTYQWSCSTATVNGSAFLDSASIGFYQAGTHTLSLTVTDTATGCDSTITKQVYIDSVPAATVTGNTPVCKGSLGVVYTATYNANYSYSWATLGGTIVAGASTNSLTVNWPTAGSNNVQVTVSKQPSGCSTAITYNVLVLPPPATGAINHN